MCHSIPVKSVENDKVAGSCLSEPHNEDQHQSHETSPEEDQGATAGGEESVSDTGAQSNVTAAGDAEGSGDVVGTDPKEVGEEQNAPEETLDGENKMSQAVSVSKQGGEVETVDSETGAKKVEEDEKTEEKAAADSASTLKESSSVEGDDQKKRFVAFCILETKNGYLCCFGPFVLAKFGCSFGGKNVLYICFVLVPPFFIPCTHLSHFIIH